MRVAVVGASRGIGLEFVRQLSKDHEVYAFCRQASGGLRSLPTKNVIEGFDVSDPSAIKGGLASLQGETFDWLLHVSGIMQRTSLDELNVPAIQEQLTVNAVAPVVSTKAFLPHLSEGGKIGWLTSRMGSIADNTSGGSYGYRMSKAAMNMAGVSMAQDIKESGRALFLLHPGYVKTDMTNHTGHIDTEESVRGLIKIMEAKGLQETGTFWHTNGEPLPW